MNRANALKWARRFGLAAATIVALVSTAFLLPDTRPLAVRAAVSALLLTKGLELRQLDLSMSRGLVDARGVAIDDRDGRLVFAADRMEIRYGATDRALGVSSVVIDKPYLGVYRASDGTYELADLFGGTNSTGRSARIRATFSIRDGSIDIWNPTSPSAQGRHVSIDGANAVAIIDQGGVSKGIATASVMGPTTKGSLRVSYEEDDAARFGTIRATIRHASIAPIVDLVVSSPSMVMRNGTVDADLSVYGLAWRPGGEPEWHAVGTGFVRGGSLRISPLTVEFAGMDGPIREADGVLEFPALEGTGDGVPVRVNGTVRIAGGDGPMLALRATAVGPLDRLRHWLAFSKSLPLHGDVQVDTAIRGDPANPHVTVGLSSRGALHYGSAPIKSFAFDAYYHDRDLVVRDSRLRYARATVYAAGDIDFTSGAPDGDFDAAAVLPSDVVPMLVDVDATGLTRAFGQFSGPVTALQGSGYASVTGGPVRIDAALDSTAQQESFTARLDGGRDGGEMLASGAIDRGGSTGSLAADLYARRFAFRSSGRTVRLPGFESKPLSLPEGSAVLDGSGLARGSRSAPAAAVDFRATRVSFSGAPLGSLHVTAAGLGPRYSIQRLELRGPDAGIDLGGKFDVTTTPDGALTTSDGAFHGSASADLSRVAHGPGGASVSGYAGARFEATFAGDDWLVGLRSSDDRLRIDGIPIDGVDAIVGSRAGRITIFGADVRAADGDITASGSLPGMQDGDLRVAASRLDLSSIANPSLPVSRGTVTAIARISGTSRHPLVDASATLSNGSTDGHALAGDVDVAYARGTMRATDARVDLDANRIDLHGAASGLAPGSNALSNAALSVDATMPYGDLATLTSVLSPSMLPLTGIASATLHLGGEASAPAVSGAITVGAGTARGVAFDDLTAAIQTHGDAVDVSDGSVVIGHSRLHISGSLSPGAMRVRAASSSMDLDDFNEFFDGKDVMDGVGSMDIAFSSDAGRATASGFVRLHDAMAYQLPLGTVSASLSSLADGDRISASENGPLGSSTLAGTVGPSAGGSAPQADLFAVVSRLDLARAAPYARLEDQGIAGTAQIHGRVTGPLNRLSARAAFDIVNGRLEGQALRQFAGAASYEGGTLRVPSLEVAIDGAQASASAQMDGAGEFAAHARVNVDDMAKLARLQPRPLFMNGNAVVEVAANGSLRKPVGRATFSAGKGQVQGVRYDSVALDADYRDGMLVTGGTADLGAGRGTLAASGRIPMRLFPFEIGPNDRPVALELKARGLALAMFDPFLRGRASVTGTLDGRTVVRGTVGRPSVFGGARIRQATVESPWETVPVTAGRLDLGFNQSEITIRRAGASLGGGALALSGSVHIVPATAIRKEPSLEYTAHAAMRDARIDVPRYMTGTVNADVALDKSGDVPFVSGDVALTDTSVPFASILALASGGGNGGSTVGASVPGLPRLQPGHIIVYGGSIFGDSVQVLRPTPVPTHTAAAESALAVVPRTVDLGLRVDAGRNVGVSGVVNVTGTGTVAVGGDLGHPVLNGTLTAVRGRAGFLNTTFELEEGALTFDPADGLLPTIDAEATTSTDEADITVSLSGRVDQLHTDFESNPDMPRDAIIAALLHIPQLNSALQASQGQQQSQLGVSPSDVVTGALAGQLLGSLNVGLEQFLNVGEVDFAIDSQGRPTLELRKQVGPRVYSVYRTTFDVPPAQSFGIDYLLRQAVQIELSQTQQTPGADPQFTPPMAELSVRVQFH
jgi:autotransporter translocation and assembly factor TamB